MILKGWTGNNINRQTARLKQIYRWATGEELTPPEVNHALSTVKVLQPTEEGVSEEASIASRIANPTVPFDYSFR